MTHFYPECPDNPGEPALGFLKDLDCPRCLHKEILWFEKWYRDETENAINGLNKNLE